jgi:signal transduction histidine kinase
MDMGRVLVADDDPVAVKEIAGLLGEEGHEVSSAGTAAAARTGAAGVDAAIVGVHLAGAEPDGLALLDELAAADPALAVLALVSSADADGAARARAHLGPLGWVVTPVDETELLARVGVALERRRLAARVAELGAQLAHQGRALAASNHLVERTTAELRTTSSSLATATERLVEAEKLAAVGRVVTGIAHELSEQLALVGYAEAIKSRVAGDAELVELAEVIVRAQKRLAAMVDEIRDFTDTGAARRGLAREPADLAAVVDEALGIISYDRDVRRRRITRAWRARPLCALDQGKFAQVVINLVSNAVLATEPGDEVVVAIDGDGAAAVLTVVDRGVGMAPDVVARLGEPFFTTRGNRGSGLGVGICRRIVEEHGGSLEFRSAPGEGTTARVTLPALEAP